MKNEVKPRNRDFQYVYFIENHIINTNVTISLENNTNEVNGLKEIPLPNYKNDEGNEFKCTLFRFKLEIKQKKKVEVTINLKDDKDETFSKKITISDPTKDNFIYDVIFEPKKTSTKTEEPPTSFNFDNSQKFEYFVGYLRSQKIKQKDQENLDLILSTQSLLIGPGKKYKFSFYLKILLECFATSHVLRHLLAFKSEKIQEIDEIKDKKSLKVALNVISIFEKNPDKVLDNINGVKDKEKNGIKLYTIIIFFYCHYSRDKLLNLFSNKNEKIQKYIFQAMIQNKKEIFKDIKLTKEEILNLMNCASNIMELFSLVSDYFDNFCEAFSGEDNKKKAPINIEKYINPSENDDIKKISEIYKELVKRQKEANKNFFFLFESSLLIKYAKFYEGKNLENLFIIKEIGTFMKDNVDQKFEIKDLNEKIHETGIIYSNKHTLKNNDILEFIKKDEYYNSKEYNKKIYRSLDILNGLDINTFDDEFYLNWKARDWYITFDEQYYDFIKKISDLIKDMKDFDILFKLFDLSKDKNQPDYHQYSLNIMQSKFCELQKKNYDPQKCPNFVDNLILLIFFSDQKRENIDNFLTEKLQKSLNAKSVNEIYLTLLSRYKDLISQGTRNIITNFFIKNESNKNIETLLYLIKNCPELCENILQNIDEYIIKREDLLEPKENNKLLLFKGLLEEGLLEKPEYNETYYVEKVKFAVQSIQKEINSKEILYRDISKLYSKDKNDEENQKNSLLIRLKLICLNKQDDADKLFNIIDKYYSEINSILEDLKKILEDFLLFFKKKEKENIKILKKITEGIKCGSLNYYENNYNKEIKEFIQNYKKDVEERNFLKQSEFFSKILENNKKSNIDDGKCLEKTKNDFNDLSNIFKEKGIQKLEKNILKICLKTIKGKTKEEIRSAIINLKDIFEKIKHIKVTNEEDVINDMIILSKKDDIYNATLSIMIFIEKLGLKKGSLWEQCDKILSMLENSFKKEDIEESISILNTIESKIDSKNSKDKKYLNILLQLKEQPESITFLLQKKEDDCRYLQELAGETDNGLLNSNDIIVLEKCVIFMKELGNEEIFKSKMDIEGLQSFKEKVEDDNNIEILLTNYVNNYPEIKSLFESGYDKSEASKQKILLICKKSKFILANIKGKFFEGEYYDENNTKGPIIKIKKDELLELRDRAQLTKNVKNEEEENKIESKNENINKELNNLQNFRKFVEKISEINNIYDKLKEIYMAGYPKKITIQINIEKYESTFSHFGLEEEIEELKKEEKEKKTMGEKVEEENNNKINEYLNLSKLLQFILDSLRKSQISAYIFSPLIRFIYGRQFNFINNILKNKEIDKNKLSPFLMLLTNSIIKDEITFDYKSYGNVKEDMIKNIEDFLQKILKIKYSDSYLKEIYKNTLIKKDTENEYKGVYLYLCDKLEKDLFQIYKYLTNNIPVAQTILLCNKETTNEELTSFLYRAILCEYNSCFIIGGVELLEFDKKSKLLELLNKLYVEDSENMNSCLIILYTTRTTDIFKSLDSLKNRKILDIKKDVFENFEIKSNVEIISSDFSGVGKSTEIRRSIEEKHKNYIYFPIGGVFKRKDIVKRLKNLEISKNSVLHLDLYDTEQTDLMMEFLFSILITRLYGQNEDIFYLFKEVDIKIEIPNGFIDFFQKFPILTLFDHKKLSINNLAPLIIENKVNSKVQIVANYLKALEEENKDMIDAKNLFFETISPKDFLKNGKNYIEYAKILNQSECQKLIFKEIKTTIENPNYYQITSFIDILAEQFSKFSKNFYLEAFSLKEKKNLSIRRTIIESFIKLTKHFTEGAFTSIVKSQKITHDNLFGQYDENKDNANGIEELAKTKHDVVSFKKIDPSLLFFHEGESQSFSIITNKSKNDAEYLKLLKLKNYMALKPADYVDLPNYKLFKQNDFLEELKDVLGVKNKVAESEMKGDETEEEEMEDEDKNEEDEEEEGEEDEEEKDDKNENEKEIKGNKDENNNNNNKKTIKKESLEKIADKYILTPDNFVKMALILLRIRANIPVIMMGETGCGKTSLIRKLSQMLNNGSTKKMKILNIHAGINDKDIINFLKKKVIKQAIKLGVKENKQREKFINKGQFYTPKKLWVFLDEINTCKSMGLISEIMCKHSYQGNPLPSNIVFIAACNPYRQGKKNVMKNAGINILEAHKELKYLNPKEIEKMKKSANSNLVYTVNPLPHSLLNFVFDFGNLTEEDEEKYISSMILDPIMETFSLNKDINNKEIKDKENEKKRKKEIEKNKDFISIHQFAKDMIVYSQKFIRERNDISSVSLREIRRFNIFYEFFFDYLKKKKNMNLK